MKSINQCKTFLERSGSCDRRTSILMQDHIIKWEIGKMVKIWVKVVCHPEMATMPTKDAETSKATGKLVKVMVRETIIDRVRGA